MRRSSSSVRCCARPAFASTRAKAVSSSPAHAGRLSDEHRRRAVDAAARARRCARAGRALLADAGAARAAGDRSDGGRGRRSSRLADRGAARAQDLARDTRRARSSRQPMAADAARRARERDAAHRLAGAAAAGRRSAARRDRAARRQGQDRAAGRSRHPHLHRRAVRGTAQLDRRGAQRGARASGRSAAAEERERLQRHDHDRALGDDVIRRKRTPQLWTPTVQTTGWAESTLAEQAWVEARGATLRWAIVGAVVGVLVGLVAFAPASWLAHAIASATGQRLVLADARGTIWSGSAVAVLAGGPDSRDATYLPGRLEWTLAPRWYGVDLAARHDCCINGTATVQIRP